MLRKHWKVGLVALAALVLGSAPAQAQVTLNLGIRGDVSPETTMKLGDLPQNADTEEVCRWRSRVGFSFSYGYSRPYYSYYPRSYSYGYSSYYYPRSYSYGYSSYYYPRSYSFSYYSPGCYSYPSYYCCPIEGCLASTPTVNPLYVPEQSGELAPPRKPVEDPLPRPMPKADEQTFPYNGGPEAPVPMPQAQPKTTPAPSVPLEGHAVSLTAPQGKFAYPAYGEEPRRTSFAEDRTIQVKDQRR